MPCALPPPVLLPGPFILATPYMSRLRPAQRLGLTPLPSSPGSCLCSPRPRLDGPLSVLPGSCTCSPRHPSDGTLYVHLGSPPRLGLSSSDLIPSLDASVLAALPLGPSGPPASRGIRAPNKRARRLAPRRNAVRRQP
ncbi:unnamed protein product, partial [Mesorhabditis spiculigera]